MPAAPVLEHQPVAPRPPPAAIEEIIARTLDPRLAKRRDKSGARLATEVRLLERLLKATPKSDRDRPALLRRLAETRVELGHTAKAAGDIAAEKVHRTKALRHYESLQASHPSHASLDQVLYHSAIEHQRLGDLVAARRAYLELIKRVSKSKLVPYAYLAFGELFNSEATSDPAKVPVAERFYEQVLKYSPSESPLYGLSQYRLGHLRWRAQYPSSALECFVKALRYVARFPQAEGSSDLAPAAMDAAIHTFAESGRPDRACPFFHRIAAAPPSPDATLRALTTLGESYLRTGRRAEAITIYRILERYHRGPERRRDRAVLTSLGERDLP